MPSDFIQEAHRVLAQPDFDFIKGPGQARMLQVVLTELGGSADPIGVDTETTGLDPRVNQVRLVQVASRYRAVLIDLDGWRQPGVRRVPWEAPGLRQLKALLESSHPKVLQNAAFDLNFLRGEEIVLGGPLFDTMVAAKLINNGIGAKNDLGALVQRGLKFELPKELQKADWSAEISEEQKVYAARDALCLGWLRETLEAALLVSKVPALRREVTLYEVFKLEMSVLRPIALMQWHGFGFNAAGAASLRQALETKAEGLKAAFLEVLDAEIQRRSPEHALPRDPDGSFNTRERDSGYVRKGTKLYAGFNPRSPQQMALRLEQSGIILPPDEKGKPSLDQNLLAFLKKDYPLISQYLEWKESVTLVSAVEKLLESIGTDGRIHASYRQMGAETGRLSCAGPNLQQVPREKEFRSLFVAAEGYTLIVADFSQVELRMAAELSGEPRMREAYAAGRDLHTETAALIAGVSSEEVTKAQRQSAKVCFSGDTEVLTEGGWVRLDAYDGQRVAQYVLPAGVELNRNVRKPGPGYVAGLPPAWDGNCGALEFVDALAAASFWSDDVWASADRNYDVVATGNHEILYIDAYGNAHKQPLTEVVQPRLFVAAGYLRREPALGVLESRLLAMVVAEGSFKSRPHWVSLGLSKWRKIHRCGELLNELGIEYIKKKKKYSNGENGDTTYFLFRLEQAAWLLNYTSEDKELHMEACLRDVDALSYLAEAQCWDGVALDGQKRDRVIVTTTVKATADVMQAMAVSSGIPCTVHETTYAGEGDCYRVSYAFRTAPTWRASWEPQRVEAQQVYCVQVPSGLLLIRRNGKVCVQGNCNFGLLYGAGPATLRKQAVSQYGIDMELDEAKVLVEGFRTAYPDLFAWQQKEGSRTTRAINTATGRRRMLVGFNDKYTTRINTQVQGSAGDIAKIAIAMLWKHITRAPEDEARLIAMVHDEIVLEVREAHTDRWAEILKSSMEGAGAQICRHVPIVAEVSSGATWADAK